MREGGETSFSCYYKSGSVLSALHVFTYETASIIKPIL